MDFASRYLICCDALSSTRAEPAFTVFERAFRDLGLPKPIRTDNGAPFASPSAIFAFSKPSVWWLRLGIGIERIQPCRPTQNGRHERMHLTLKKETTKPAANNFLQQQEKFDHFIECYNHERPHQAIEMRYPGDYTNPHRVGITVLRRFSIRSMTAPSPSPCAAGCASAAQDQSLNRLCWPERRRQRG